MRPSWDGLVWSDVVRKSRQIALELLLTAKHLEVGLCAAVELGINGVGKLGHSRCGCRSGARVALGVALAQKTRQAAEIARVARAHENGAHGKAEGKQNDGDDA